jgi:hypothetical protein
MKIIYFEHKINYKEFIKNFIDNNKTSLVNILSVLNNLVYLISLKNSFNNIFYLYLNNVV